MIDYEKLKIAHELAKEYSLHSGLHTELMFSYYANEEDDHYLTVYDHPDDYEHHCTSLDELISKLRLLIHLKKQEPSPKYKIGDTLWKSSCYCFVSIECDGIRTEDGIIFYTEDELEYKEEDLYPSKLSLIEAQIEKWTCLKSEEISTDKQNVSMESVSEHIMDAARYLTPFEGDIKGFDSPCTHKAAKNALQFVLHDPDDKRNQLVMIKCTICGNLFKHEG